MKKELDKELYPDYVYPEFTPDCIFRLCRTNCTDVKSQSRGR